MTEMPERPEPQWTVDDYERWLLPAFDELASKWSTDEDGDRPPWLGTCDREFLDTLGFAESEVESQPDLRVLHAFMTKLVEDCSSDDARRSVLLDERARDELIQEAIDETAEAGDAADAEPASADSVVGLEWVTPEQQVRLGEGWDTYLWAKLDGVWPEWRDQTRAAPLVDWLDSWMPSLLEERGGAVGTAGETQRSPEEVAAQVGQQIAAPALTAALARPELADLTPEEVSRLVSAIVAQRAASAAQ